MAKAMIFRRPMPYIGCIEENECMACDLSWIFWVQPNHGGIYGLNNPYPELC